MASTTDPYRREALNILATVPLIDGHNDWAHFIRGYYDNNLDDRFKETTDLAGHVDLKRLLAGKSGGVFWSAYVDCPSEDDDFSDANHFEILRDTMQQIDVIYLLIQRYSNVLEIVQRSDDIMRIFKDGKVASLIGVEGLHQICNSSSVLRNYHRLGVRYVTLTHNKNNMYADSATGDKRFHGGLSACGKEMVKEMNRIGMMIDLSHVSRSTMHQVLDMSDAPVIFSHSSIASIVDTERNVDDESLKQLQTNGGLIMISLIPALTHADSDEADISHVVDHMLYVAQRIGFEHVGIGSDFDGMVKAVKGIDDVSLYPDLVATMLSRGISREDTEKVIGLNLIRVMGDVEKIAERTTLPPFEDKIKPLWNADTRRFVRGVYPEAEPPH